MSKRRRLLICSLNVGAFFFCDFFFLNAKFKKISAQSQISGTEIVREVMIERDGSGSLGLSIAGGIGSPLGDVPVIIASMQYDGAAARTGKLAVSIHP